MPCAQVPAQAAVVAQGQEAARRHNALVPDDHGAVVKGGVGLEDVGNQGGGDFGIQRGAGVNIVLQAGFLLKHDEGAHPAAGEAQQALGNFVHNAGGLVHVFGEVGQPGPPAHLLQGAAQLRLKEDQEHDGPV